MLETVGQLIHETTSGHAISFTVIHICIGKDNFLRQSYPVPKSTEWLQVTVLITPPPPIFLQDGHGPRHIVGTQLS